MPRAAKKTSASLVKADYELLAEFRYTLRKFLGFSESVALEHGVTPQQHQGLLAIQGYPGRAWVTIGEFAERMQVAHHSAVGLVDRMEALKLVRREASKEDRRRVQVTLTDKGLAVLEKLYRAHREELQSVGPQLVGLLRRATTGERGGGEAKPALEKLGTFASPACSMPEIEDGPPTDDPPAAAAPESSSDPEPEERPLEPRRDDSDDIDLHLR
jgi:DNA-binding MarR family transcriptional regulator